MSETVRLTVKISRETDLSLRRFLGSRGMKKGDISRFVDEAIRWRMLDQTVQEIKERNQDLPDEDLETAIDKAVREVREMRS